MALRARSRGGLGEYNAVDDFNLNDYVQPEFLDQGDELDTNLDLPLPSASLDEFWGAEAE